MEQNENVEELNPWLSIWLHPRKTIRYIVESDVKQYVILLAVLSGISESLARASEKSLGDKISITTILALSLIGGAVGGIITLYVSGALLKWTGKWLGGKGTGEEIRAAVAWGSVPEVVALFLTILEIFVFGKEMFTQNTPNIDSSMFLAVVLLIFGMLELVLAIWCIFTYLKCLGEVQGFSAWKALGNTILAGLVILVPIVVLALIVVSVGSFA